MSTYVALLRGINVAGKRKLPMADLRRLHARLGHADVVTYIQSGNVVFDSDADPSRLAEMIGTAIEAEFGFAVPVMIRTAAELEAVVAAGPYQADGFDPARVGVAFLDRPPEPDRSDRIDRALVAPDEFALIGREVHLHCPSGFGRTKLTNSLLEAKLGVAATTRNWKTVCTLREMSSRQT